MTWLLDLIMRKPATLGGLALLCLLLGAGGAWWVQGLRLDAVQARFDGYVAQAEANTLRIERELQTREALWKAKVEEANERSEERLTDLKKSAAAARAAADGLRGDVGTLRDKLRRATENNAACSAVARTASTAVKLLGTCGERYGELAARADGHANDVRKLSEAWPK
jgi:chromosome segregation ATPase